MNANRIKNWLNHAPVHIILIGMCVIWLLPTIGLLVTSFRPFQDINRGGWWAALTPTGQAPYNASCASCHGSDGKKIASADLSKAETMASYQRSFSVLALLKKQINGAPHLGNNPTPTAQQAADIVVYIKRLSGVDAHAIFTFDNYIDALVGYRGTTSYRADCAAGTQSTDLYCDLRDLGNPRGMGRAFLNSLAVAVPSTILPILFAAFAAYAFSWMHFRGRQWLFALLVGLQIVPLQMTLIPISRLYAEMGLSGTFLGIWLFHTGFGLPYAIYLMRNFMGSLPRELFESVYLDGASHWTAFWRLALRLSIPAISSLAIFQFLWIWNDLLVALVFLGGSHPVMTYQISNMVTSHGSGWHLMTAAAFLSMLLPMIVFFSLQRYFVRGMLAGAVKG
jgi:alpha-glucoside transport system permease protein